MRRDTWTTFPSTDVVIGVSATSGVPMYPACRNVSCERSSRLSISRPARAASGSTPCTVAHAGSSSHAIAGSNDASAADGSPIHTQIHGPRSITGRAVMFARDGITLLARRPRAGAARVEPQPVVAALDLVADERPHRQRVAAMRAPVVEHGDLAVETTVQHDVLTAHRASERLPADLVGRGDHVPVLLRAPHSRNPRGCCLI